MFLFAFFFSVASGTTLILNSHFPNSLCWGATNGEFNVSLKVSHLFLEQLLSTNMSEFVIWHFFLQRSNQICSEDFFYNNLFELTAVFKET